MSPIKSTAPRLSEASLKLAGHLVYGDLYYRADVADHNDPDYLSART